MQSEMAYYKSLNRLLDIMNELRDKCPWDKKQTIHTLRAQTIEELYELTGAITDNDWNGIKEELGDLLLHIVFYSKIASEQQHFSLGEVIENVCNKLVARHPHIYDYVKADDENTVKQNWEKLKLQEGKTSALSGVPKELPAIIKAYRIQEKAKQTGFEWDTKEEVYDKVKEELNELQEAIANASQEETEKEFGDVLFSLVNYARFLNIDPEQALELTNKKFIARFQEMEVMVKQDNKTLHELSLTEMDALWNKAKKNTK